MHGADRKRGQEEKGTDEALGKRNTLGVGLSVRVSLVNRVVNISAVTAECSQLVPFAWQWEERRGVILNGGLQPWETSSHTHTQDSAHTVLPCWLSLYSHRQLGLSSHQSLCPWFPCINANIDSVFTQILNCCCCIISIFRFCWIIILSIETHDESLLQFISQSHFSYKSAQYLLTLSLTKCYRE